MREILAVDLPDAAAAHVALEGVSVRSASPDDVADQVSEDATVAVVAGADVGVAVAQAVHATAPAVPVLYVAFGDERVRELNSALGLAPGIGRHTRCIGTDDPDALPAELARALLGHEHRRSMGRLRDLVDLGGGPPETLSVYLGQLFDHAPLGILLADPGGVVRAANPASGDVLGWQPRLMVGEELGTLLTGDADMAARLVAPAMDTGRRVEDTLTRTGPEGTVQHLDVSVAPVDPEHWNLGVFVLLRDETARIEALETAELARRGAEAEAERYAELAWTLQESLLPPDLPEVDGVGIGACFHPAGDGSEIGGDFFDIFQISDAEWFAVVGDVCGKGAGAARLTALTRYTLRATTVRTKTVERNLSDLNVALSRQYELDRPRGQHRFATATAVRFRVDDDGGVEIEAGSGGHPPPLVVRADGRVEELVCRGPLLGVFPAGTFVSDRTHLGAGDVIVLYTDGVLEARRGREEFGEDRLRDLLAAVAGEPAVAVAGAVEDAVLRFQAGTARDDIAVLALAPAHR